MSNGIRQSCLLEKKSWANLETLSLSAPGVYISVRKRYLFSPPPSENYTLFPSRDMSFFDSHRGLFALILPYFAFILPFYFPFSHFLSPFFLFLSLFFLVLLHFLPFSLGLFLFFPPNDIGWYFPPIFSNIKTPAQNSIEEWDANAWRNYKYACNNDATRLELKVNFLV